MGGDGAANPHLGYGGLTLSTVCAVKWGSAGARHHREKSSGREKRRQEAFSCAHVSGERFCSSLLYAACTGVLQPKLGSSKERQGPGLQS